MWVQERAYKMEMLESIPMAFMDQSEAQKIEADRDLEQKVDFPLGML